MLISPTEAGRLGIVNALVGSTVSAVGGARRSQPWGILTLSTTGGACFPRSTSLEMIAGER